VLSDYINSRTSKSARKRQGRPSRGTPTPSGYGYLTRHLPRKVTLTRINDFATDEQVRILETRGKGTQLYKMTTKCLGLSGHERHTHALNKTAPAESDITRGRSGTLGFISILGIVSTFGGIWPGLGRRRGRKDLHLEGGGHHQARIIIAKVSVRVPARANTSTDRSVASASCPSRTSAWLMASAA
jgi:hypothetical protein